MLSAADLVVGSLEDARVTEFVFGEDAG